MDEFRALFFAGCLSACGSGGSASLAGHVADKTFSPADAIFQQQSIPNTADFVTTIVITSTRGACEDAANEVLRKGASALIFTLTSTRSETVAADYTVASNAAKAVLVPIDDTCQTVLDPNASRATSGKITLTEITPSTAKGTFDLSFGAEALSGTFAAVACGTMNATIHDEGPQCL